MTEVIEMFKASPKVSTLGQCEFCQLWFEHEDLMDVDGASLCEECRADCDRVRVANQLQKAMDELPADELLSLRWVLSIALQQFEDKSGCENIHKWNDRITSALKGKAIDEKKLRRHSGLRPNGGDAPSHTHQNHSIQQ